MVADRDADLPSLSLVRDAAGQPVYAVAQVLDITERRRAEEEWLHHPQAFHDGLTGLPNRDSLMLDLESGFAPRAPSTSR